jgi:single-stranded DNA-binding protein
MVNVCVICGNVASDPELTVIEDKVEVAIFNLDISYYGISDGWIKILCLQEEARFAAQHIRKDTKVVVTGNLIRGSYQRGEAVWWQEIRLSAIHLQLVE